MATHRAVHVDTANGPLRLVDVETTPPPRDHVRIAVHACASAEPTANLSMADFPTRHGH
jgi:alcohol dehydrogenase